MASIKAWLVVADGARARVFRIERGRLTAALNHDLIGSRLKTQDIDADRAGQSFHSTSARRHSVAGEADAHGHAEAEFARTVAAELDRALKDRAFDRFILAAPPRALGLLRAALTPAVRARLAGDIARELVSLDPDALLAAIDPDLIRASLKPVLGKEA